MSNAVMVDENQREFLLKEFERLRIEIDDSVKETRTLERNAVISSGAIWAWALVNSGNVKGASLYILLWLPVIIVAFSMFRAWALHRHLWAMGEYLAEVAKAFVLPLGLGWEQRFAQSTDKTKSQSATVFWIILLFITALGAGLLGTTISKWAV
jgi:hypothetical protein